MIALAALLAGCGPSVERAYTRCADAVHRQALEGNRGLARGEAASLFEKAARLHAAQQCQFIRDTCNRDPQSADCRTLIEQYAR